MTIDEPYTFHAPNGLFTTLPAGYKWDGATIPRWFWSGGGRALLGVSSERYGRVASAANLHGGPTVRAKVVVQCSHQPYSVRAGGDRA